MMARRAAQVDPLNAMGQVVEVDEIIRGARGTQKKRTAKGRWQREGDPAGTPHETRPGSRSTNTEAGGRAVGGRSGLLL